MEITKKASDQGKSRKDLIEGLYRLSGLQQGMLFHGLYNEGKGAYLEQMSCDFINLDIDILKKTWDHIIKRHSILRTSFIYSEISIPVQSVNREVKLPLEILDYSDLPKGKQEAALKDHEEADRNKGFDFNVAPLMRIALIKLSEDRYRMLWTWHHILFDGWSLPVLMEEFLSTYETYLAGKEPVKKDVDKFEDYIRYIERGSKERQEKYWRNYMKGIEQSTLLPFIGATADRTKGKGEYETEVLQLDEKTTSLIEEFAQRNRLTINTVMQGVWSLLLHHYTGNENIAYGVIVSGRPDDLPGVEQRVGLYINTLPLHSILKDGKSLVKWLQDMQKEQLSSRLYQHTPLQDIQKWTGVTGDLFDSLLVFENFPVSELVKSKKWSLAIENVEIKERTNYPLTLMIGSSKETTINFSYNSELLNNEYVKEIKEHFRNVLLQVIDADETDVTEIDILTKDEKEKLLVEYNDTTAVNDLSKSIADLFEAQAAKTPDNAALIFDGVELSYSELNRRSNQLAHLLKSKGVKADSLVPVCLNRGFEMITAVLAVLKAGGAYVPIDPEYPSERKEFMLKDSGAKVFISSKDLVDNLDFEISTDVDVMFTDSDEALISGQSPENLKDKRDPENLAYMLYTSGSTGNPKGVRMPGRNLVNLLLWQDKQFKNRQRKVLQFTALNFDVSFQEIFSTLCFGSTLCLITGERRIDMAEVMKDIQKSGITHLFVPFIVLKNLAEYIETGSGETYSLEEIITAGEQLKLTKEIKSLLEKGISIVNQYGPTEAHVVSSYTVPAKNNLSDLPPIGKPVDNTQLYILDGKGKPVPAGVAGELYIAGVQVAKGYLNLPELTEEKFVKDIFSNDENARMYRTGDLARWLPDGNIEYLGRSDDQIKIRGYRVELGEIESVLQKSELVKGAVVLAKEDKAGNKRLIGYVVPNANGDFDKGTVDSYLRARLPEYMVPGVWVKLDSIPLNANGKVDRKALPDPDLSELLSKEYTAPRNDTEEKLEAIWKELLGVERARIYDNFFELGGHSLLVIRLISAVRKSLDIEITVNSVFENPNIKSLAEHIQKQTGGLSLPPVSVQKRPDRIPLSYSQERLWFIDRLEGTIQYHIPAVLRLKGKLNKEALIRSMQMIVERHEVLRTVIYEDEGKGYQSIKEKAEWDLEIIDGSVFEIGDSEKLHSYIRDLINIPFDLSKDLMLRGHLIELDEDDNILIITMHHIASDGWSISVIVKEFAEIYKSIEENREAELPALDIQYADYAIWQKENLQGEVLENKIDYWRKKLDGVEPLQLPTDHSRKAVQSINGNVAEFKINKELSDQLQSLSRKQNATLFMTLLSAFNVLLYRYSGQKDICVGSPIAGRQMSEIEDLIGYFVNTLAFRSEVNGDDTFANLLKQVKSTTLEAYEHQEAPFEKVVDAVVKQRDMSRSPVFQVAFALQNMPDVPELYLGKLELSREEVWNNISRFDITFSISATEDGMDISVEYCTDLYNENTIKRMLSHYNELLQSIVKSPDEKIGLLPMLSIGEEHQLLYEFNDTKTEYPSGKYYLDFFHEQVNENPDSIAVRFENKELTYSELNKLSNQLAHYLKTIGIKNEMFVPICLDRSPEMIIGILGILKAGAAYVPVDPDYPEERIKFMLSDTGSRILLCNNDSAGKLSFCRDVILINLEEDLPIIREHSDENLENEIHHHSLAYMIYTSGSTGKPKGVMNEHGGIMNRLNWAQEYFNLTKKDSVLQKTTFCFDVSVWELLLPLMTGARLVFAKPGGQKDTWYLKSLIENEQISILHFVPSMLVLFLSDLDEGECLSIKKVVCSGEALKPAHVELFKKKLPTAELHNLYGPTEAAIDVTYWEMPDSDETVEVVPIGKPVANTSMYILDEWDGLVPLGGIGQLHIGGVQVARGYLNRPELTEKNFVDDPFNKKNGSRMYRTGDIGRWLPDGNIEYLGRLDDQVKIRGNRIELGEIETCLTSIEGIKDSKVVMVDSKTSDDKKLNAYLQIDKETLPILSNYQHLIDKKNFQRSEIHILPNEMPVFAANQNEVKFLYNEIFEDQYYLKNGITLSKDSTVIDIGANVGFFTVFLNMLSEDIKVYSFEPVPDVYNYLEANRSLYNIKGKGFQLALLDKEQDIEFIYYPSMSILSGITEDKGNVKDVVRSYIDTSETEDIGSQEMESLLEAKLASRKIQIKAKRLSDIISEEKISKIDLLKIDVENSEHLVLAGLDDKDWSKVNSLIIEIHDVDGRLKNIKDLLEKKGFSTYVEKEKMLSKDAVLYNLYAVRKNENGENKKNIITGFGDTEKKNLEKRLKGWINPPDFGREIRIIAEKRLPDYMVPSKIIFMDEFPLTANGKLNVKALPDPDSTELSGSIYEAPRNKYEEDLASIWKELLHVERVGIKDNFFELGGDSMITIQIISRARRLGYELKPKDFFMYQTIDKMSVAIAERTAALQTGEQGSLTGESGLLPIQHWYLSSENVNVSHFNQAVLLSLDKAITPEILNNATEILLSHHDALRFRYKNENGKWIQEYGDKIPEVLNIDLRNSDKKELGKLIEKNADEIQSSLNIENGEIVKFALMQTPDNETHNRVLIVIHHLAVDGVSWRLIFDDLEVLLTGLIKGEKVDLGTKGSSYRQWHDTLVEYSKSRRLLSQKKYWERVAGSYHPLLTDKEYDGKVTAKDIKTHSVKLDAAHTQLLLQEVPAVYHTEINDILLCALALTLSEKITGEGITIGLEGHGRENISENPEAGIDTSRTVGWFTSLYPVLLEVKSGADLDYAIKSIKEQLRNVPDKGLGYGVLKYINNDEKLNITGSKDCWDIVFNYLGQLDNVVGGSKWFSGAGEASGGFRSEEENVREIISVNSMVQGGELVLNWSFSSRHFESDTISDLGDSYKSIIEKLISHCIDQKRLGEIYTPSDYGLGSEISVEELDRFLDKNVNGKPRRESVEGIYRLSGLQQGMLFHSLYDSNAGAYTEQLSCDISDPDTGLITKSWNHVIKDHSILRSGFYYDQFSIPVQCVYSEVDIPVNVLDFSEMNEEEQTAAIEKYKEADRLKGFDFKTVPLMRIALIRLSKDLYRMIWTSHHILSDGWSLPVMLGEFLSNYETLLNGSEPEFKEVDKFEDYIRYIENIDQYEQEAYWKNYMQGVEQSTLLPFIEATSQRTKGVGEYKTEAIHLNKNITEQFNSFAQKNHVTINTVIQGVWSYLLHKYTGNENIVYGIVVSGRPADLPGIEHRVGMYINTLPLHSVLTNENKNHGIVHWLNDIQTRQVSSTQYQYTPLQEIQSLTGVSGDLFDSILVFENYPVSEVVGSKEWSLKIENIQMQEQTNYPLTITVGSADEIDIHFSYNSEVLSPEYVKEISGHFENVLLQIINGEAQLPDDLKLLTKPEENRLVKELNDLTIGYPKEKTIVDLFNEQVAKTPENTAIVSGKEKMTYKELNERSNRLANYLIGKGVKENDLIPVCIERGFDMIVGLLAILKAGGAYVPIDPEYPEERLAFILEDTSASLVVSSELSSSKLPVSENIEIVKIDSDKSDIEKLSKENLNVNIKPDNFAYVIYTSGSTGKPKGVLIQHYNVVRLFMTDSPLFDFTEKDVWSMFHSFTFDFTVWEMYGALFYGGKLVIVPRDTAKDPELFSDLLVKENVTILNQIPSSFYALQETILEKKLPLKVRYLIFGGEALDPAKLKEWKKSYPDCRIINMYGITETTVHVTYQEIEQKHIESGNSIIGNPIPTLSLYILDKDQKLLPAGVAGELCVGGAGLARGYLNRPDLTKDRFIKNIFSDDPEARLYRSGDLGKRLPDGNIEYLGRIDEQVKIRGYRIELGEIESVLNEFGSVRQAIVLAKEDKQGIKYLVAYIVAEGEFNREEIITYLKGKLPDYMIPALYVSMESFPFAASGKINKKALPDPDASTLILNEYIEPRNDVEKKIAAVWKEVLNVERVGINDNFFELGGHSLLAMRVISSIRKELESELAIKDIFVHPTIAELADIIKDESKGLLLPVIGKQERPDKIQLSFSQERLWFIDRFEGSIQYHMPVVLRFKGLLNKEYLSKALQTIINRHEILRTMIREEEGVGYQYVKDENNWDLEYIDGSVYKDDAAGLDKYLHDLISVPFDLSKDYMIRGHLISLSEEEHILEVTMHHIASDGWSMSVLVKEMVELYAAYSQNRKPDLEPLAIQYIDYAIWQRRHLQGEIFDRKLNYWKQKLNEAEPLTLPTDFARPAIQSNKGAIELFNIDKELSEKLQSLSQKHGATLFMTLLTAFKVLLYRYTGQEDIVVGIGIAGRQSKEMEELIGFFVNTLALRSEINSKNSFVEMLNDVKTTTMEAYENQEVPFEKVVDTVVGDRDMSKNPLVQVSMVLQNTPTVEKVDFDKLTLSNAGVEHTTSKFDLTLYTNEIPEGIEAGFEYATDLFSAETIRRMIGHYLELLHSIINDPECSIGTIPMLTAIEKQQLLYSFNDTFAAFPENTNVVALIEEMGVSRPDAQALVFEDIHVTYHELNEISNRLANYLISKGVKKETLVPVFIDRSIELIAGVLAVLKAGGAYVPVDPDYPPDRISFMLEDTEAKIVLSSKGSSSKLPESDKFEVIEVDGDWSADFKSDQKNPGIKIEPNDLAYVIYTSGSTGKPKGVMIEHSSLMNLVMWHNRDYEVTHESRTTTMAGIGFDAFGWEIWPYLSVGAGLYIVDDDLRVNPEALTEYFNMNEITHSFMSTAIIQDFINASRHKLTSLKYLLTGGDKLSTVSSEGMNYKFINNYGPTENTVVTCNYPLFVNGATEKYALPPIGKPIANTVVHILSKDGELVPVGVIGEINIGGAQLARGYLNRSELTSEKFVADTFNEKEFSRMYRTGDLGRWLPDGNIEFSGRLDDQVKIRGYRIELGEIENVINNLDSVRVSCIVLKTGKENRIIGYYVPETEYVKTKEHELYQRQIAGWKELYDTEYSQTEDVEIEDVEFNIIGWNDSFTGGIIEPEEMRAWRDDIVDVILSEEPVNVLEIGSGTGLIYYELAEKVKKYIGTDFSRSSMDQIRKQIGKGLRNYCETDLRIVSAHEIEISEDENIDTVILNSIVQYFPGEDYMDQVVGKGISVLKGNGRIIIGDVRDNRLLEYFKGRLHINRLNHSASVKEFKWAIEQDVIKEEELCFDPEYFVKLKSLYPEITNIEIKWKQASYINELSLYRYTAVIHVGDDHRKEIIDPKWQDWKDLTDTKSVIEDIQNGKSLIAVMNVPNPRLVKERLMNKALNNKDVNNVGDILEVMSSEDMESKKAKEIIDFAISNGYTYRFLLNEDPLLIDLVLESDPSVLDGKFLKQPFVEKKRTGKSTYTNIPLMNDISLMLKKDIKNMLQVSLPDYMIPSELIVLNQLPLTNNGKVDRKFLSQREDVIEIDKLNYIAPETDTEKKLTEIWQDLLGVEKIGVHDNFFELGGHSLLGMRVISAIRKKLDSEIAIKDLFVYPTVSELSRYLDTLSKGLILPPVTAEQRPEKIPLSYSQERLWFIDQLEGSVQYHVPAVLRLKGKLNIEALTRSLQTIINRHEVLRSVILQEDGAGYQVVQDKDNWDLEIIDGGKFKDSPEELQSNILKLIGKPFDLSKDHMMRIHLIRLSEDENILVITMHHIASDGWSVSVIVNELAELYEAFDKNTDPKLPALEVQYADFAIWQRKNLQGEMLNKKLDYWRNKLADVEPIQLPIDFERPAVQSIKGANVNFEIGKDLSDSLQTLSKQNGATLFMTLLAAFNVLLNRYSGQENISVGTPIAGRQQEEVEKLIGFFVNTLTLRNEIDNNASFLELLKQVRSTTLEAYDYQDVPFEKIVDTVAKQRDMTRSPLFQIIFALQNTPDVPELNLGDVKLSNEVFPNVNSKFDLTFFTVETPEGIMGSVEYCTDLFKEETINKMIAHFKNLLNSVVKDPEQKTGSLQMLSKEEEEKVVKEFNETASEYPSEKSIVDLFEEQVTLSTDAPAVLFENEKLTYKELDERSNQVAHYLRSKGVEQGTLVPLCIERSAALMVGIIGVLKAGCAYVPIDPEYPEERIRFMLKDTASNIIISSRECVEKLPALEDYTKIEIDTDRKLISEHPKDKLPVSIKPEDLAYIIYTSGSTGWPKGVMVTQKNVVSLVKGVDYVTFTKDDVLLSTGSTSFDATTFEYWGMLLNGGQLVLCTENRLLDSELLKQEINSRGVTKMWFTSSWFNQLVDNDITVFKNLKTILAGGEKLSEYHIEKMRQTYPEIEIINGYGPTENTTFSLTYNIKETDLTKQKVLIPIGRPLSNRTAYVLNKNLQPVPVGVTGEVYLGGDGVSNGYLNNPDLTKERFVNDPFSKKENARLYKTGDLGRWKPDGNIEYLGRADEQVKIRGYRIELGEIENALQECELVKQAVVLVKQSAEGSKRLVGYVVSEGEYDKDEIIKYLSKRLPDYMVPAMWVKMDKLPLTQNGKVDRRALPEIDGSELMSKEYVAPRNEMETALAEIWKNLLHIDKVGIHDNFFELGGHSLLAMRVISSVRNDIGAELAIKDLFLNPNIADLAEHIETQKKKSLLPSIEVQTRPELIPLSFSQERLWFIDRLVGSIQYHLPAVLRLKGQLNVEALEKALQSIINRHEVIRTVIQDVNGKGYQKIKDKDTWKLQITDDSKYKGDKKVLQDHINELILAPFDLTKDHMLRCKLIKLNDDEYILVMTMHHIASDGWSISIIVNELLEFYKAFEENREPVLKPLQIQYADYSIWQKNYLQAEILEEKINYWKKQLRSVDPLELPTDFTRPAVQSIRGAVYGFSIDKELSEAIKKLSKEKGTTLFMTLLAAFNVLLYRYSGQNDISVGTPVAGRMQEETEELIGFFINTLTLRNEVNNETPFNELLNKIKTTTLEAYEHQDVPFEKVVESVVKQRDQSRSPLFQVMFVFQNTPEAKQLQLGNVELSFQEYEYTTSMFDFTLNMFETLNGLQGSFQYCTDLFSEDTIKRMIVHFKELLSSIVNNPDEKAGLLTMLSESEENTILSDFKGKETDYPKDKTIVDLFEEQSAKTPDNIALAFKGSTMSYKDLNERSNKLAHYLISKGIKQESFVPICIERGFDMIVGIFGILKAGGVYVPVDPDYPEDRIRYVTEDTKASIVISSKESSSKISSPENGEVIKIDEIDTELESQSLKNPGLKIKPQDLAYVIYTSGSTGKPKGVMIEHYNVVRLFMNDSPLFDFNEKDVWTMFHSFCFDFSVWEMYGALFYGGKLIIVSKVLTKDASLYSDLIISENVTVMNQTPSAFYVLQENLISKSKNISVRYVIFGGEALNPSKLLPWKQAFPECKLINMYGITETTVHVTFQEIGPEHLKSGNSIIGKPIPTLNSYILDSNLKLVPVGVPGEINVGGAGLARGYLNAEDLSKQKFIPNPYLNKSGERIYRSGDLGKWHPDGRMEYLGRIDEQVKIRGFRIELGEIESVVLESGLVKNTVVIAKEDKHGIKSLIGYVVGNDSETFDKQKLIAYLKSKLPDYMVPLLWVELDELPLTSNGKIDRKALPDPDVSELTSNEYAPPTNEIEGALVGIWQELLNVKNIGINDNFFELGGHSLLALQLFGSIEKLSGRKFPISTLFNSPTIKELAAIIKDKGWVQPWKSLVPIKPGGSRMPLYCVPNAGGTALQFQELLKYVSSEQPIYVLESIGLDGLEKPHTDLKEMSAFYIKEIRTFQPKGPYMLCGRCFGGRVVYEMAQQLMAAGEEVALLAIFDTWPPFVAPPPQHVPQKRDAQHFITRTFYHMKSGELFTVAKNYTVNKFMKMQRKIKDTVGYLMSDSRQRRYEEIKLIHFKAQDEYVAKKYPGKITLIECEAFKEETREKWKELAGGGLESYTIPGTDHKTIVTEPYIRDFAEKLNEVLKQTDDEIKSRSGKNGSVSKSNKKNINYADV